MSAPIVSIFVWVSNVVILSLDSQQFSFPSQMDGNLNWVVQRVLPGRIIRTSGNVSDQSLMISLRQ